MPMPKPGTEETHDDFVSRCMGTQVMVDDFDDEKQRYAVCEAQWDRNQERTMKPEKEVRVVPLAEVRATTDEEGGRHVSGTAIAFGQLSEDLGGWRERIHPKAVKLDPDMRAFFNHDTGKVIGRAKSGTLSTKITDSGVHFDASAPQTTWADDMLESMRRGDIDQCSFGFYCLDDEWNVEEGMKVRTVTDAEVFELSVVSLPAYPQTAASARDMAAALDEIPAAVAVSDEQAEVGEAEPAVEPEPVADRVEDPRFHDPEVILG